MGFMQKLTAEQAQWLIEDIIQNERELILSGGSEPGVYVHLEKVKQIINQYTEKEFPGFRLLDEDEEVVAEVELDTDESISIFCPESLSFAQFKRFTEGCNKIVEYLNEL